MLRAGAILLVLSVALPAQEDATRAAQIEADRQAKAASSVVPAKTPRPSLLKGVQIWNFNPDETRGLALRLGGLADGSGLALGPEYILRSGHLIWDSYAVGSLRGYYRLQAGVEVPDIFSVDAFRFDYPRLAYYLATERTDYRMQDTGTELRAGPHLGKHLRIGTIGTYQHIDILRGTDSGIAQTGVVIRGSNVLSGGFFARYDDRDMRLDPHAGTFLSSQFENVSAGYNRYDLEAQHYFHYWNKRRVIATRLKSVLTTPHSGSSVPFYLEPTVGGSNDLRGFAPYRFYGQNSVLASAEYRWTAMENFDMAIFTDAGKVYRDADTFSTRHMKADIGFGLRGRVGDNIPLHLDVGISREGVQVWFMFFNAF